MHCAIEPTRCTIQHAAAYNTLQHTTRRNMVEHAWARAADALSSGVAENGTPRSLRKPVWSAAAAQGHAVQPCTMCAEGRRAPRTAGRDGGRRSGETGGPLPAACNTQHAACNMHTAAPLRSAAHPLPLIATRSLARHAATSPPACLPLVWSRQGGAGRGAPASCRLGARDGPSPPPRPSADHTNCGSYSCRAMAKRLTTASRSVVRRITARPDGVAKEGRQRAGARKVGAHVAAEQR